MRLQSLRELNKLVPDEFRDVRNLFQILLAETFAALKGARDEALKIEGLNSELVFAMESEALPFEPVSLTMQAAKRSLADTYLSGEIRTSVEKV